MWKDDTMLPFKAPNPPFFILNLKSSLSTLPASLSLPSRRCQEFSRLFSQLGGWKSDTGETRYEGTRYWRRLAD